MFSKHPMKPRTLREEISTLKLELLSEEEASYDTSEIIKGTFVPLQSPESLNPMHNVDYYQSRNHGDQNLQLEALEKENMHLLEKLQVAESTLAMRSGELFEAQRLVKEINTKFQVQSNYFEHLYKTLSAEFVLAVKHIGNLEDLMKKSKVPIPPRPDLKNYDIKAPRLPAYMQDILHEHAAQLIANAAINVNSQMDAQFEEDNDGQEINQYLDPSALIAQQMIAQQMMAQQQVNFQQMAQYQNLDRFMQPKEEEEIADEY